MIPHAAPKQRLVVIGNGMAGMRTVEELVARAPQRYDITVLGAEPHPNYNRILLSSVLAGEKRMDEIVIHARSWYEEHGITLIAGDPAKTIDARAKMVAAASGRTRAVRQTAARHRLAAAGAADSRARNCPASARFATSPMSRP